MQRFKGDDGVEAACAKITGKIIPAYGRKRPIRVFLAQSLQHPFGQVYARHPEVRKARKIGSSSNPLPQPMSRSVSTVGGSSAAIHA